ncbi:MAG: voltage-gated sodium channel [Marinoscillum sp.]|jgi:voltage-gated sodium channel
MTQTQVKNVIETNWFQKTVVSLIILNSVLIGLETSPEIVGAFGFYIDQIDRLILLLFVIEIILKLYAYGLDFFKSAWNLFDTTVIVISIIPSVGAAFSVLRALRILRTLRLLKNIPKLKLIIESLLHSIPSIGWIAVLLVIIFYIFAVIGNSLFGVTNPDYFGSLVKTTFTLFQIMTLESWASGIARPIISQTPFAAIYFVVFILIATYTTLNIFIAIVVNTMNELHLKGLQEEEKEIKKFVHIEHEQLIDHMEQMEKELGKIKKLLKKKGAK